MIGQCLSVYWRIGIPFYDLPIFYCPIRSKNPYFYAVPGADDAPHLMAPTDHSLP